MAQAWPGLAQARPGARYWKSGDLEIQKFGSQKIKKIKILKIQIRSAQIVGKVWISRKQILLAPFVAIPGLFLHGPKKCKKYKRFAYFPLLPLLEVQAKGFMVLEALRNLTAMSQ